jgi:hypothetical protein
MVLRHVPGPKIHEIEWVHMGQRNYPYWDVRSVQIPRVGTMSIALSQLIR